ncbi:hypothetical protein EBX31_00990 [bacterium]|nr:hypothetical protein [bacterium]
MISPFCPKCRAVILPGRSECPDCKEPVRDHPGVTDSLRKVEAPSTRGDLFCPSCHGLIFNGDTRCPKCGMILSGQRTPSSQPSPSRSESFKTVPDNVWGQAGFGSLELASLEEDSVDDHDLTLYGEERTRWKTFLEPLAKDLEAEFHYVISHELVRSSPEFENLVKATRFIFLKPPESYHGLEANDINACATKKKDDYYVIYLSGQAVCDRLIGGILSAADLSLEGDAKMPLEEVLVQIFISIRRVGKMSTTKAVSILDKKLGHLLDDAQLARARDLASLIGRWTIAHEIGHIIRGHCDMASSLKTPDVLRNNERDADHFAHNINNLSAFPEYSFLGGLMNNLQMVATSGRHATLSGNTHPAPMERLENLLRNADSYEAFRARFNISKENIFTIAKRIMM